MGWEDSKLQGRQDGNCDAFRAAAADTAAQQGLGKEAAAVIGKWCYQLQVRKRSRLEEVRLLQKFAAMQACQLYDAAPTSEAKNPSSLVDVLDSIAEIHRLEEADQALEFIG